MTDRYSKGQWLSLLVVLILTACSTIPPSSAKANARLTPSTSITRALTQLPEPRSKIAVAVYGLRDQTGQYKSSPESPYSTEVTQGAASMLVEALRDSGWYIPVEREGLQNLLTERRIVRAIESPNDKGKPSINLPGLIPASLIMEGGVIAYESNVRTGGKGANFLGIGGSTQYHVDQVTVGLRSVDIRTGQVLNTVSVTKTIFSYMFDANVYKFTSYQHLLQGETGFTTNEPGQLALKEAIESAVVHLTLQGVRERFLELKDERDWNSPIVQSYLKENERNMKGSDEAGDDLIPLRALNQENQSLAIRPLLSSSEVVQPAPIAQISPSVQVSVASQPAKTVTSTEIVPPMPSPVQQPVSTVQTTDKAPTDSSKIKNSSSAVDIFSLYRQGKQ